MSVEQNDLTDSLIADALAPYGVYAPPELCEQVRIYIAILLQWNAKIALTTVTDIGEILRVHFGESVFAGRVAGAVKGRAADIGTGAGFPGIPIRMVNTQLRLTLIEPVTKKTAFLGEVLRKMQINDVTIMRCRMEEISKDVESFDFVFARALGRYEELLEWVRSRIPPGGKAVLSISEGDAVQLRKNPALEWSEPVKIPKSEARVVLVGNLAEGWCFTWNRQRGTHD